MKKFLKISGVVILAIIAFVLIAGIFVPKTLHLEKNITINAPKDTVWNHVSSLQAIDKWSPWKDADPNLYVSFEGQEGAVGSLYHWKGNKQVGSGNQTITKIDKPNQIESHLNFIEPFSGEAESFINLADAKGGTKVTWGFDTKYPYPMNVMQLFIDVKESLGTIFNTGLSRLKQQCEQ